MTARGTKSNVGFFTHSECSRMLRELGGTRSAMLAWVRSTLGAIWGCQSN
jgi:hypothetical protein